MRLFKSFFFVLIICTSPFLSNCDNPAALTPGSQRQNIVTGINITNEESPNIISKWGYTNFPGSKSVEVIREDCGEEECPFAPESFKLSDPYPNPTSSSANIPFQLPIATNVTVWLETAEWVAESNEPIVPHHVRRPFQRYTLIDNQRLLAGNHTVNSGTSSLCFGGDTYPGFYRIYIQAGDYLSWRDIYIYGPSGTNPPGLGNYEYLTNFRCDPDRIID